MQWHKKNYFNSLHSSIYIYTFYSYKLTIYRSKVCTDFSGVFKNNNA